MLFSGSLTAFGSVLSRLFLFRVFDFFSFLVFHLVSSALSVQKWLECFPFPFVVIYHALLIKLRTEEGPWHGNVRTFASLVEKRGLKKAFTEG